jgi:hypothetical protein
MARLSVRHSFAKVLLDLSLKVVAEFLVQFLLDSPAPQKGPQSKRHCIKPALKAHL